MVAEKLVRGNNQNVVKTQLDVAEKYIAVSIIFVQLLSCHFARSCQCIRNFYAEQIDFSSNNSTGECMQLSQQCTVMQRSVMDDFAFHRKGRIRTPGRTKTNFAISVQLTIIHYVTDFYQLHQLSALRFRSMRM
jgi:hypothetical protein